MDSPIDIKLEDIICPISHQIFCNPVVADDGITYEEDEIKHWMKEKKTSPLTGKAINTLVPNHIVKTFVDKYLAKNTNQINNKYKRAMHHLNYIDEIAKIIEDGTHEQLLLYNDFHLEKFYGNRLMVKLLKKNNVDAIKHVIANAVNLEVAGGPHKWSQIHYVLKYSTYEIQKYVMGKNIDLEIATTKGCKPIHYACKYGSYHTIKKYFLSGQIIQIDCVTNKKFTPAAMITRNNTLCKAEKMDLLNTLLKK